MQYAILTGNQLVDYLIVLNLEEAFLLKWVIRDLRFKVLVEYALHVVIFLGWIQ